MTLHLYPRSCVIIRSKVIALSSLRFSSSLLLFHLNKSSSSINNPIKAIWNWGGREVGPVLTQTMTTAMWKGGRSHPKPKLGYPKRAFQHRYIDKKQEWPGVRSRNIASLPPPWPCIYIQDHASSFMSVLSTVHYPDIIQNIERILHGALSTYEFRVSIIILPHEKHDKSFLTP